MNPPSFELTWLDAREAVSVSELSLACGMSGDELAELVDYGALIPLGPNRTEHLFSAECVPQLRTVGKLRLDFDLDVFTVALLMGLPEPYRNAGAACAPTPGQSTRPRSGCANRRFWASAVDRRAYHDGWPTQAANPIDHNLEEKHMSLGTLLLIVLILMLMTLARCVAAAAMAFDRAGSKSSGVSLRP